MTQHVDFTRNPQPDLSLPLNEPALSSTPVLGGGSKKRIDFMAAHMVQQWKEHEAAQRRTADMFEQLLCQMEETVVSFQDAFSERQTPNGNIYARIDADRSVGIIHLLWHTLSFTPWGNIQPMALKRSGRDPMFSGRIVALLGDYQQKSNQYDSDPYSSMLDEEFASLFIPASTVQPAMLRFRHNKEELYFHQADASQQFLLKVLEAVCSGGYFHELD